MSHVEQLAGLIAKHESRAEKLRSIQALLADDPELVAELRQLLFPSAPNVPRRIKLVVDFLRSKENEWLTARDIAQGTGLPRNTVNFLLFASKHGELFESEMRGPKNKVWRLKASAMAKDDGILHLPKPEVVKESRKKRA